MGRRFRVLHHGNRRVLLEKPTAQQFADALNDNEERMAEMAAMAVTCEQFSISEDEGYDLLISLDQKKTVP